MTGHESMGICDCLCLFLIFTTDKQRQTRSWKLIRCYVILICIPFTKISITFLYKLLYINLNKILARYWWHRNIFEKTVSSVFSSCSFCLSFICKYFNFIDHQVTTIGPYKRTKRTRTSLVHIHSFNFYRLTNSLQMINWTKNHIHIHSLKTTILFVFLYIRLVIYKT